MRRFPISLWSTEGLLKISLIFAVWMSAVASTHAVEATRCSFDPSCLCIEWSWDDGTEIEIRCPGGSSSGWAQSSSSGGMPDIIDSGGSFRGNGRLAGALPLSGPASQAQMTKIRNAKNKALAAIQKSAQCAALFANSPLPLDGVTVLNKIAWLNGEAVQQYNRCDEPDGRPAYYASPGEHVPQIYVCDAIMGFSDGGAATLLIHEALHVSGQGEDQTALAGPGDFPNDVGISFVVAEACNLPLL